MVYYMESLESWYIDARVQQREDAEHLLDRRVPHRVDGEISTMSLCVELIELVGIVDILFSGSVVVNGGIDVEVSNEENALTNIFLQLDNDGNNDRSKRI